ncbi:MAG TPA: two-component regulator propeller domain-containing protein, partial [Vicinamibacteria bacterium]|nr:two-component regulator propeller domain-containing protein [Vicinamibacteria bacterium]
LNRYDGVSFRVYRHDLADRSTLPSSFVWDLEEDAGGGLWIATSAGLARWERATGRITRQGTVAGLNVRALRFAPRSNVLWIGTRDSGLLHLDLATGLVRSYRHDEAEPGSLADDRVYALYVDGSDRLWVGTDGGLDRLDADGERFEHYAPRPADAGSLSDARVRAIAGDATGALWVGTLAGGLHRLDPGTGHFDRFRHDPADTTTLAGDQVRAILHDADGRTWVGTSEGLDLFDPARGTFAHYRHEPYGAGSLADKHVLSLAQDRGGVLWVGTRLGGAHKWNPLGWQFGHVPPEPANPAALASGRVSAFSEDRAGRLWVGTRDAGLYVMERTTRVMRAYRHQPGSAASLPSDRVAALHHDHRGDLWIGTVDAGLVRMSAASGALRSYRSDRMAGGLEAEGVTAIVEDAAGRLWLGTSGGGVARLDPASERFTHFRHHPADQASLAGDHVSSLAEAPDGALWIGTTQRGLDRLDPHTGRFSHFRHRPGEGGSLPSDTVHALFVDAAGGLWVGTQGGLGHLPPGATSFEAFTSRDGLSSDVVYGIRDDRQGRLWITTNRGLSRLDPRTRQSVAYGSGDGLQGPEFSPGASYQSARGELFFGGLNGFNAFKPDRLRELSPPPPVVLTSVLVDHRPVAGPADQTRRIRLGRRDKVLGLEFAALDFTAPDRNRFSYRLEGFDAAWVPLHGRHDVTYTNLRPGRYTFRLRAANRDGLWNEEGLSVAVEVATSPWASPWAFTGYSLFLMGAMLGMARIQQRRFDHEAEYARVLEFRVQDRTRELSERQRDLEKANRELSQASLTDSLTGLANRRFLTEYLEREAALLHRRYDRLAQGPIGPELLDLAFLMIDLDHFKNINDSAGHAAGDAVLRQLRDLLESCRGTSDVVVRWGGDEFLLVARDLTDEGCLELAERIRASVAHHVFAIGDGQVVRTTCSVGVARYPFLRQQLDALSWEQVISVADHALYVAKASGRNAWVGFHPGTSAPAEGLFGAICHGTARALRQGTLRVTSSLPGIRHVLSEARPDEDAAGA